MSRTKVPQPYELPVSRLEMSMDRIEICAAALRSRSAADGDSQRHRCSARGDRDGGAIMSPTAEVQQELQAEATRRVRAAMALIEDAQGKLGDACALLSSLQYGAPTWRQVSREYDRVHALWYRVQAFWHRGRYRLDPISVEAYRRRSEPGLTAGVRS